MTTRTNLSRVADRDALKRRDRPYWHQVRPGCFVGYRPGAGKAAGLWRARAYDEEARRYREKALGAFGDLDAKDRFAEAKKGAEAFAAIVETGGEPKTQVETVAEACRKYAEANTEAEGRFRRYVYDDPLGKVALGKLRKRHLEEWRTRLEAQPALVSRNKDGERVTRARALSTVNRDLAMVRAALRKVLALGQPKTDAAWQEALLASKNADGRRTLYLDRQQRRALLAKTEEEAEPFVRALCLLPLRPGAVAGLSVRDFDVRTGELTIGKDKAGNDRRILVPDAAAKLLAEQGKDKLPAAPLFMRRGGARWDRNTWKKPITQAAAAAELPAETTAYTLRHSTITDLVMAGLPLLTIAQISGTSAAMIERHYGHLVGDAARKALARLAL
jgi:integrase